MSKEKYILITIAVLMLLAILTGCTKINYDKVYPVGTRFDYAAGPLSDLKNMDGTGRTPTDPWIIDTVIINGYGGGWTAYKVTSANGMHTRMSNADIKVIH